MKIEIIHDQLAQLVYKAASFERRQEKHAYSVVDNRFKDYQRNKTLLLGEAELKFIEPFLDNMNLPKEELHFINSSQLDLRNRQRSIWARNILIVLLIITVIFLPLIIWGGARARHWKKQAKEVQDMAIAKDKKLEEALSEIDSMTRNSSQQNTTIKVTGYDSLKTENFSEIRSLDQTYTTIEVGGLVLKGANNKPIAKATVKIMGAALETDDYGRFSCFFIVPPLVRAKGIFLLKIEKDGYQTLTQKIDIRKQVDLKLFLQP